ncbi:hypothetical protein PYW07_008608 [Mythimna separata]|uniref:ER-bound oxygenase mpaB/mpaB'/Rubber oxygenase catalytic domain-containing protein n=1 Tax=Mythimna separata TaxID=271217 RepID=A0AAD7YDH3_MYTSE|nr:hypothetical protein PYW07_008608 [Mythimna separata]
MMIFVTAEAFVDALLTKEAAEQPSDKVNPDSLVMELPDWFDEKKYNRGRNFYMDNCFALSSSMLMGLVAVFAVPSILNVLVGSRRSTSVYTAYKRYLSTLLHTVSWFENELKPGSISWRSLYAVRSRHLKAGLASKLKGTGTVSQRDLALTQFGFIGFSMLKPDKFGIRQLQPGDWDAYNYVWRVVGHMIGIEDKYNIARETFEETREVLQLLQDRVFTPALENVPEYFEHMARVMLDGMWSVNPTVETDGFLYWCRRLADVPGYIYTENDRLLLQEKLRQKLKGKSLDTGVDSTELMRKPEIDGLPTAEPRLLYYHDYDTVDDAPFYKRLNLYAKYKIYLYNLYMVLYSCAIGRWYFNLNFKFSLYLMRYFPYLAFFRFGIKKSLVNIFEEDPTDDSVPKLNIEYTKPQPPEPWYKAALSIIW